jgi:histidine triad (HIT) family protein
MHSGCIFCRIAAGEIPSKVVFRDEDVIAIEDVNPQAPVHVLVMPVAHHPDIVDLSHCADATMMAKLFTIASRLGHQRTSSAGFRMVVNTGPQGGQTVDHLHVHVLGGRPMKWPPG